MSNAFGTFLKDRRTRIDPIALGMDMARRRTPGLRREEVASRASVSPTWYTWLEQGRGGAPSPTVLDRIARALLLTEAEREHLFLLGLGRPPERQATLTGHVTPRLQRILDAFTLAPAFLRTPTWDVVAWNAVAAKVLHDYGLMPPDKRNIIRMLFTNPAMKKKNPNWARDARFVVATFRADVTRAGATRAMEGFIDELSRESADFAKIWQENDVQVTYGETPKLIQHPELGKLELEYSAFAVEGRPDLIMVVYNPATEADAAKVRKAVHG
ncbi:helix-turn-helix transcriptional regulator [Aestuariivirga litoralis]|uniref:helix-turn-helix transcriptional regulator n=1 Tax=Aestuariivirga litoralis TaxID=2650924 RepID=UPI001FEE7101|nr:helix-turn-helix transcriptional regulator [Aestuariivirga litoralis]